MNKRIALVCAGVLMAFNMAACKPTEKAMPGVTTEAPKEVMESVMAEMTTIDGRAEKENMVVTDAEPACTVSVFTVKEDGSGLKQNMDSLDMEEPTAQALIDMMVEYGVIEDNVEVEEFSIDNGVITMNLSELEKKDDIQILGCIANTFIQNFEADKLVLSVEGEPVGDIEFIKNYKEFTK